MSGTSAFRTRFLVSVRSGEEAGIALAGGADIIDAKEPRAGALGAVALDGIAAIVEAVGGQRPVSATIGDCDLEEAAGRVRWVAGQGVDYVKIGLFGVPSPAVLRALEQCAGSGIRLIAVMFADSEASWTLIHNLAACGFVGVMLDTADKARGGLRSHLRTQEIVDFLTEAHRCGLLAGLAGSLHLSDARVLLPLRPDVLGFRGALCARGARAERLDVQRVTAMGRFIRQDDAVPVA
jgi:uncharacterized protein (UPF0264 family)